jgi:integrase
MRWQDLDLENGVWTVPATWSKNRRELAIPLTNEVVAILKRREHGASQAGWVWPSDASRSGHVVNPEKPWRRYLAAANISEHTSLHDVRRTLGSNLAKSGVATALISKVLGHISPQSAKAYVHLDVEPAKAAIEKVFGEFNASEASFTNNNR